MTVHTGYLPLSQEQDGASTLPHTPTAWWATRKAQLVDFAIKNGGLLLVICSQFFFVAMNLSVKSLEKLDPPTPILELLVIRMAVTVCCCMTYMVANKIPDALLGPKGVRGHLAVGGLTVFVGLFGMYYSLSYISVADTTVISFIKPFTVALAGYLLLGESYTTKEALAALFSLLGVILIARPPFLFGSATVDEGKDAYITPSDRLRAVGTALMGVCGGTGTFIIMRAVRKGAHAVHVMTFFSFWCAVVASIAMAVLREPVVLPMTWQWIALLFLTALFGVISQILVTMGLRYETATRGALATYTQLLFAVILELVAFGTMPSLLSVVGAAIILAAQAYAVLSKHRRSDEPSVVLYELPSDDVEEHLLGSDGADPPWDEEPPRETASAGERA